MTLYEINEALRNALQTIDPETGEITADLDELEIQRSEKIEGIALSIKEDTALAEAIEKEAKTMMERAKVVRNRADWKKRYLTNAMTHEDGMEKYTSARVSIGWRKTKKVEIPNEEMFCAMNPSYCVTKTEVRPDRTLIRKSIEDGCVFDGAVLVENNAIQIK